MSRRRSPTADGRGRRRVAESSRGISENRCAVAGFACPIRRFATAAHCPSPALVHLHARLALPRPHSSPFSTWLVAFHRRLVVVLMALASVWIGRLSGSGQLLKPETFR
jgi:hypothetical protein